MKKRTKQIILGIVMLIVSVCLIAFGMSTYQYYSALHIDDPIDPYVFVHTGDVTVTRGNFAVDMIAGDRYSLIEGDVVITRNASDATIFWPDHSTTELGPNSKLVINTMRVARDYSSIELEATLEQWKMWTNMVRTLYPGSYMNVRLPERSLVAGVRGTVFEINLEKGYIHAVDHAVTLKNILFQQVTLFPGKIVSVFDIFKELWEDVLDTVWIQANMLKNQAYNAMRLEQLEEAWSRITGELGNNTIWDSFVRYILSFFDAFAELKWAETFAQMDIQTILEVPQEYLFKWYQMLKGISFAEERDMIRGALSQITASFSNAGEYMQILFTESLWDKVELPTIPLEYADAIIQDYARSLQLNTNTLLESFRTEDYSALIIEKLSNIFGISVEP